MSQEQKYPEIGQTIPEPAARIWRRATSVPNTGPRSLSYSIAARWSRVPSDHMGAIGRIHRRGLSRESQGAELSWWRRYQRSLSVVRAAPASGLEVIPRPSLSPGFGSRETKVQEQQSSLGEAGHRFDLPSHPASAMVHNTTPTRPLLHPTSLNGTDDPVRTFSRMEDDATTALASTSLAAPTGNWPVRERPEHTSPMLVAQPSHDGGEAQTVRHLVRFRGSGIPNVSIATPMVMPALRLRRSENTHGQQVYRLGEAEPVPIPVHHFPIDRADQQNIVERPTKAVAPAARSSRSAVPASWNALTFDRPDSGFSLDSPHRTFAPVGVVALAGVDGARRTLGTRPEARIPVPTNRSAVTSLIGADELIEPVPRSERTPVLSRQVVDLSTPADDQPVPAQPAPVSRSAGSDSAPIDMGAIANDVYGRLLRRLMAEQERKGR